LQVSPTYIFFSVGAKPETKTGVYPEHPYERIYRIITKKFVTAGEAVVIHEACAFFAHKRLETAILQKWRGLW
jgi:hypothetical protein